MENIHNASTMVPHQFPTLIPFLYDDISCQTLIYCPALFCIIGTFSEVDYKHILAFMSIYNKYRFPLLIFHLYILDTRESMRSM